jgi:hypothetical protein
MTDTTKVVIGMVEYSNRSNFRSIVSIYDCELSYIKNA